MSERRRPAARPRPAWDWRWEGGFALALVLIVAALQLPGLTWRGIGCIALGIAVLPAAMLADHHYPRAPGWAKRLKITKSDRRWAWRYRLAAGGLGLVLLIAGVGQLIQGLS